MKNEPILFTKEGWLAQCAILCPNMTEAEREAFWNDYIAGRVDNV